MTDREQAIELYKARQAAMIRELFHNGPKVNDADFNYRHGWVTVGTASVNCDDVYPGYVTYDGH